MKTIEFYRKAIEEYLKELERYREKKEKLCLKSKISAVRLKKLKPKNMRPPFQICYKPFNSQELLKSTYQHPPLHSSVLIDYVPEKFSFDIQNF